MYQVIIIFQKSPLTIQSSYSFFFGSTFLSYSSLHKSSIILFPVYFFTSFSISLSMILTYSYLWDSKIILSQSGFYMLMTLWGQISLWASIWSDLSQWRGSKGQFAYPRAKVLCLHFSIWVSNLFSGILWLSLKGHTFESDIYSFYSTSSSLLYYSILLLFFGMGWGGGVFVYPFFFFFFFFVGLSDPPNLPTWP